MRDIGAGAFILACMKKPIGALRASNVERAAATFKISVEWARHYLETEIKFGRAKWGEPK